MDSFESKMSNGELAQQLGTLVWLFKGDQQLFKAVTMARVGAEVWQRLSGQRDAEALRSQTILSIVNYVKQHPNASQGELAREVQKQIELFKLQLENI